MQHSANHSFQSSLRPVLNIIVKGGIIYTLAIIAALVAFMAESNIVFVIFDMICG